MTMKSIHLKTVFCSVLLSALFLHSCSLEEYNPGAFTNETLATSTEGIRNTDQPVLLRNGKVLLRYRRLDVADRRGYGPLDVQG